MKNLNRGAARIHTKSLAYSKINRRFTVEERLVMQLGKWGPDLLIKQ